MARKTSLCLVREGPWRETVAPQLRQLFARGEAPEGLRELASRVALSAGCACGEAECVCAANQLAEWEATGGGTDLERDCRVLDPATLAWRGPAVSWHPEQEWEDHRCPESACAARASCPLAQEEDDPAFGVSSAFVTGVLDRCLVTQIPLGDDLRPEALARAAGVETGSPAEPLLRSLGSRGWGLGWSFAESDGLWGWLDAAETAELAERLPESDALEIPPELPMLSIHLQARQLSELEALGRQEGSDLRPDQLAMIGQHLGTLRTALAPVLAEDPGIVARVAAVDSDAFAAALLRAGARMAVTEGHGLALGCELSRWW